MFRAYTGSTFLVAKAYEGRIQLCRLSTFISHNFEVGSQFLSLPVLLRHILIPFRPHVVVSVNLGSPHLSNLNIGLGIQTFNPN